MSSLLQRVIVSHRCRSTHHFIVMAALDRLTGPEAENWRDVMLVHHLELLRGAKAPDAEFKDFKNHVLHISEGEWGGARDAANEWYGKAVRFLRKKNWAKAAYALGVMSHYYADPLQPFHTAQTEEEGAIHRALEWSIAKSRPEIEARVEAMGYPDLEVGDGPGFVSDMVRAGAEASHPHYQTLIDHYDIHAGRKDPPAGLDETLLDVLAGLVAHATQGVAILFDRAFAEAVVEPKKVHLTVRGYLSTLDIPVQKLMKKMDDRESRKTVAKMYKELQATGKVIKSLPKDDKAIRKLHAKQVLRIPLKELNAREAAETGTKHVARDVFEAQPKPTPKAEAPKAEKPRKKDKRKRKVAKAEPVPEAVVEERAAEPPTPATVKPSTTTEESYVETVDIDDANTEPEEVFASVEDLGGDTSIEDLEEFEELEALGRELEAEAARKNAIDEDDGEDEDADDDGDRGGLDLDSPVVDAPSIGRKTAKRLRRVGITTVADLLEANVDEIAEELNVAHITPEALQDWQDQTWLMLDVPGLRVHDAQILVGAGVRSSIELADASVHDLLDAAMSFFTDPTNERLISRSSEPDEDEVHQWIELAQAARAA